MTSSHEREVASVPHVHVGVVEFLVTVAYLLIFTFLWRALTGWLDGRGNTELASVLAGIYS